MHFSPKLLSKGLKPENTDVPEARTDPNGTKKVSHANVPMGYNPARRSECWVGFVGDLEFRILASRALMCYGS